MVAQAWGQDYGDHPAWNLFKNITATRYMLSGNGIGRRLGIFRIIFHWSRECWAGCNLEIRHEFGPRRESAHGD